MSGRGAGAKVRSDWGKAPPALPRPPSTFRRGPLCSGKTSPFTPHPLTPSAPPPPAAADRGLSQRIESVCSRFSIAQIIQKCPCGALVGQWAGPGRAGHFDAGLAMHCAALRVAPPSAGEPASNPCRAGSRAAALPRPRLPRRVAPRNLSPRSRRGLRAAPSPIFSLTLVTHGTLHEVTWTSREMGPCCTQASASGAKRVSFLGLSRLPPSALGSARPGPLSAPSRPQPLVGSPVSASLGVVVNLHCFPFSRRGGRGGRGGRRGGGVPWRDCASRASSAALHQAALSALPLGSREATSLAR